MNIKLLVHCQIYENYNVSSEGFNTYGDKQPHWKPKGGHTFSMPVDSDAMMYAEKEILLQAIKTLVESQNSIAEKFEYVEHEAVFSEPTLVEGLGVEIQKLYIENEVAV
jgi:hypothetical protein|tara:strand:+ start:816 stop:1142 length:327 start_codon:yes stop_codon:yes gene_type:complete